MSHSAFRSALRVALSYAFFALLWIIFSDQILFFFFSDPRVLTTLQTIKGFLFVIASSLFILVIVQRETREVIAAQEQLHRSRAEHELILNATLEGIWIVDADWNIVYANQGMESLLGYSAKELAGTSICDYLITQCDFRDQLFSDQQRMTQPLDLEFRHRSGEKIWCMVSLTSMGNGQAHPGRVIGVMVDIAERKRVEQELQSSEALYRALFDNAPISLWDEDFSKVKQRLDQIKASGVENLDAYLSKNPQILAELAQNLVIYRVNRATLQMYAASSQEELISRLVDIIGENGMAIFQKELVSLYNGATHFETQATNIRLDGSCIDVLFRLLVVPGYEADLKRVVVSVLDVSEIREAQQRAEESEARFRLLLQSQGEGSALINLEGVFLYVNPAAEVLMEIPAGQLIGRKLNEFLAANESSEILASLQNLPERSILSRELTVLSGSGSTRELLATITPWYEAHGQLAGGLIVYRDITQRKQEERRLQYQSTHDSLTGLYNRRYFEEVIQQYRVKHKYPISLVMADLDGLKRINDTYGHAFGDELLKNTGKVLSEIFRANDVIARIGGDEFAVVLSETDHETAYRLLARLQTHLDEFNAANPERQLCLSFGAACACDEEEFETLFKQADQAMYAVKQEKYSNGTVNSETGSCL